MKRISNSLTSFALLSQLSADAFVPNLLSLTRRQPSSIDAFDGGGTNRQINGLDIGSQKTYEDALPSIDNEDRGTNNFFPFPTERSIATTSESYSMSDDDDLKDLYFVNVANTKDEEEEEEEKNNDDQQSPPWKFKISVEVEANIKAEKGFESGLEKKVASKPVIVNMSVDKAPTTSTTTTGRSILDEETAATTTTSPPPRRPSSSAATGRSLLDDRVAINTEGRTGVRTRKSSFNSNKSGPRKLLSDEEMERTMINDVIKSPPKVTGKPLIYENDIGRLSSSSSVLPLKTDRKLLSDEEMERTTIIDDIKSPQKVTRKPLIDVNNIGRSSSSPSSSMSSSSSSSVLRRKTDRKLLSDEEMEITTINDDKNYPHKLTRKPLENIRKSSLPSSPASSSSVVPRKTPDKQLLSDEEIERTTINDDKNYPHKLTRKSLVGENKKRPSSASSSSSSVLPRKTDEAKRSTLDGLTTPYTLGVTDETPMLSQTNIETQSPGVGGSSMLPPKTTNDMAVEDTPASTDQKTPVQPLRGDSPFSSLKQGQIAEKSPFLTPPKPNFGVGSSFEGVETDSVEKNTESLPFNGISPSKNAPMPKAQVTGSSPFTAPAASSFGIGSGNTPSQNITTAITTSTTSGLVGNVGANFVGGKSESSNFNGFALSKIKPQQPRIPEDSPGAGSQNSVPSISDSFSNAGASTDETKSNGFPSFDGFAPSNSIPKPRMPETSFQAPAPEKPSSLGAFGANGSSFLPPNTTTSQAVGGAPTSSNSTDNTSTSTNQITGSSSDEKQSAIPSFNGFDPSTSVAKPQAPGGTLFQAPGKLSFGANGSSFLSPSTTTAQAVGDAPTSSKTSNNITSTEQFSGSSADEKKSAIPSFNGFAPSTSVAKPQAPGGTLFQPPEKLSSFGANGSSFPSQNTTTAQAVGNAPTLFKSIGNTADSSDEKAPLSQMGGVSSLDNKPKMEAPGGNLFAAPLNSPFGAGGRSTLSENTTTTEANLNTDNRASGSPGVNDFSSSNNELKPGAPGGNPLNSPFGVGGSSSLSQGMTTTEAKVGNAAPPLNLNGETNLNTGKTTSRFPSLNDFSSSDDKPTPGGNPFPSPPTSPLVAGGSSKPSTLDRASTTSSNLDGKTGASTDLSSSNSISGREATGEISFGESLKKPIAAPESNTEGGSIPMSQNKTSALSSATVSAGADTDKITTGFSSPPWGSSKKPFATQDKSMSSAIPANLTESKTATAIGAGDSLEVEKSGFFEQLLDPSSTAFKGPGKPTEASPSSLMDNPKGTTNTLEMSAFKSPSFPRKEIEQLSDAQQRVDELQTQVDILEVKKQETTMNIRNLVPPRMNILKGESAKKQPGEGGVQVEGESIKDALARLKSEAQAKKAAGIQGTGNTAKSNEMIPNGTSPETMPYTDTAKAKSFEFQRPAAQSKVKGKIQEKLTGLKSEPQDSGNSRRSNEVTSDAPSTTDEFGNVKPVLQLATAKGVQVIMNWKQNADGSIFGYVYNSLDFDNGTRIVTTPCVNVAKAGYLIETESGSQYLLDMTGDVKPVLSLAASKAVKAMMKWKENIRHGSIEGYMTGWKQNSDGSIVGDINSSDINSSGLRVTTTPCVRVGRVGYIIETESGGQYILE